MTEPTLFDNWPSPGDPASDLGDEMTEPDIEEHLRGQRRRPPSENRVRALAGILAGFAFPGRGGYERLRKEERTEVEQVAREFIGRYESTPV